MSQLTPQQQRIVDFLADGAWHCMANEFFMKDDRKRISEINRIEGYKIIGLKCDKRCKKNHSSRIHMRKMTKRPEGAVAAPRQIVEQLWKDGRPAGVRVTYQ